MKKKKSMIGWTLKDSKMVWQDSEHWGTRCIKVPHITRYVPQGADKKKYWKKVRITIEEIK